MRSSKGVGSVCSRNLITAQTAVKPRTGRSGMRGAERRPPNSLQPAGAGWWIGSGVAVSAPATSALAAAAATSARNSATRSAIPLGGAVSASTRDLVHPLDRDDRDLVFDLVGYVDQVFDIAVGNDHPLDARPMRGQEFLLDATDLEHVAAQRDLAGHRHIGRTGICREAATPARCTWSRRPTVHPWECRRPGRGRGCRFSRENCHPRGRAELEPRLRMNDSAAVTDSFITSPSWPGESELAFARHAWLPR